MRKEIDGSWVNDIHAWGLHSHGSELLIDEPIHDLGPSLAVDVETDEADNFVGLAVCWDEHRVYYYTKLTAQLIHILANTPLIGHNIKSDAQWLRKWGINISVNNLHYDTMLASYVQDSTKPSHALKDLAKEVLGIEYPSYREIVGTGQSKVTLDKQPVKLVANYCGMDALTTFRLYKYFTKVLTTKESKYLDEMEMPTMRALMLMEERGVSVNASYLRALDNKFNLEIQRLVEKIKLRAPSIENINSDKQVGDFLVSRGFTLSKTPKGKPSVSAKSLEPFEGVPFIKALRRYSELDKLTGTYTKPLIERSNGNDVYRLHANFNQAITYTGRLSSSKPNLQNIPSRTETGSLLRCAFVAKPGCCCLDADYSQIEPRLFAHFSQDPELLRIFRNGLDLYEFIATTIGSTRDVAKTVWLALSYNAGAFKIGQTAHISYAQAVMFIEKMKKKFKVAFAWKEKVIRDADSNKFIETLYGRSTRVAEPSLAPNYLIQGSAAEIMKAAIVALQDYDTVLTVHDELVIESDMRSGVGNGQVRSLMESVVKLSVPLIVEVGAGVNWGEAKDNAN